MSLSNKKCKPCHNEAKSLSIPEIQEGLAVLPGWSFENGKISRVFAFKNFEETVAFVNAVTRIAVQEDHHPTVTFGYRECTIFYWTHAIKGISENDLICAAKTNRLVA